MTAGVTGGFATNTAPPSAAAFVDVDRGLVPPVANGGAALPYSTLQQAVDAGALRLMLAPGAYGDLLVPPRLRVELPSSQSSVHPNEG